MAASRRRSRTRDGPSGTLRTTTPRSASASSTALATAAGDAIAPPYPSPFTPSALSGDGTLTCASANSGASAAVSRV